MLVHFDWQTALVLNWRPESHIINAPDFFVPNACCKMVKSPNWTPMNKNTAVIFYDFHFLFW